MTIARQRTGRRGEDLACAELTRRGYAVLARRYRTRYGEIDIVARCAGVIVFVEVKARHGSRFGDPAEAITSQKQHRLVAMAQDYLARYGLLETPCRFDIVAIDFAVSPALVTVIADAFRPGWS
jgi:putative endonuclease